MKNQALTQALSTPADYSRNFDEVVEQLRAKLSQALKIDFFRDGHMDYSSSQKIELWLDTSCQPISERDAALYVIRIFISSRGRFFAVRCVTQYSPRHWRTVPRGEYNESIQLHIQKIGRSLADEGYASLPEAVLSQRAEGHLTKLDNLQATVFNVLFSELG